jgi:hypothetical protein
MQQHSEYSPIRALIGLVRRLVGLFMLAFAILGFILPIIPGWPFIVPAVLLLGRRDPWLRRLHLLVRASLRYLRRSRAPLVRKAGLRLSIEYLRGRRTITPAIIAAERRFAWLAQS